MVDRAHENYDTIAGAQAAAPQSRLIALCLVLAIAVLSFFADLIYAGVRSVLGPYLALLGASATVVGVVTGFRELLGHGLRLERDRS